jgi:MFS family permease
VSVSRPGLDSRRGWAVVAAAFTAMFVAFGIAYSYGAFLEEMRAEFGAGRATAAAFFSLTSLLYFGLGGLSGAAADRFGPRRVLLVGAAALGLGLVATARAGSLAAALLAYGLGVGIGVACAYVPMVALVGAWFERQRTLALGVAVAGIGLGTLLVGGIVSVVRIRALARATETARPAPTEEREEPGAYTKRLLGPIGLQVVGFLVIAATARTPGLLAGIALGTGIALLVSSRWLERWEDANKVSVLHEPGERALYVASPRR